MWRTVQGRQVSVWGKGTAAVMAGEWCGGMAVMARVMYQVMYVWVAKCSGIQAGNVCYVWAGNKPK